MQRPHSKMSLTDVYVLILTFLVLRIDVEASSLDCLGEECCGGSRYDSVRQLCCDGLLHSRPANGECCGSSAFNANTDICCDGSVLIRPANALCCGGNAYDGKTEACCQGTVFDRMPAEFGKQFGVFYPCAECCGNKLYPPNPNKICCDETIQDRPNNADCCGSVAYDTVNQLCCEGALHDKGPYAAGYRQLVAAYVVETGANIDGYLAKYGVTIDELTPCMTCCGAAPQIDNGNEICCEGNWLARPDNAACCGASAYDSLQQICCNGVALNRTDNAKCCGDDVYNAVTQRCCSGVLQTRIDYYCHNELYDPDVSMCCCNTLQDRSANARCCGENAYTHGWCVCGTVFG